MTRAPRPAPSDLARVRRVLEHAHGPVKRPELVSLTGLADRVVRACIAQLVLDGVPTYRNGGGYWLCEDRARRKLEIARLRSHAARILERAAALERYGEAEQRELFAVNV